MDKILYGKTKRSATMMLKMAHGEELPRALVGAAGMLVWVAEEMGLTREELHAALDREFARNVEFMQDEKPKLKVVVPEGWNNPDGGAEGE